MNEIEGKEEEKVDDESISEENIFFYQIARGEHQVRRWGEKTKVRRLLLRRVVIIIEPCKVYVTIL